MSNTELLHSYPYGAENNLIHIFSNCETRCKVRCWASFTWEWYLKAQIHILQILLHTQKTQMPKRWYLQQFGNSSVCKDTNSNMR